MKNLKAKRNSPFFVVLFFAVIFSLGLAACKGDVVPDEPEVQDSYTVTFNTNGGNTIEPKTVAAGKKVAKPKKPVREGAIFEGWYSDSEFKGYLLYVLFHELIHLDQDLCYYYERYKKETVR